MTIDLNVDLGEGFPWDEELLALATSANVCCGVHAGSVQLTLDTMQRCADMGVRIGLHPGFNDRDSMGRAKRDLADSVTQVGTLIMLKTQCDLALRSGHAVKYLKPHGAFYLQSAQDQEAADVLVHLLEHTRLPLLGLPYTRHEICAQRAEVRFIREGYIDRRLDDRGFLLPRDHPDGVIDDLNHSVKNALAQAQKADSLCIHGDKEGCVQTLDAVRCALIADGFEVRADEP
jgi:UPF0271 protein